MKNWTIEEFLAECAKLRDNQYTYNYDDMPEGICNNHRVEPFKSQWRSISIDNCVHNLYPADQCKVQTHGKTMTSLEFAEEVLRSEAPKHYKITFQAELCGHKGVFHGYANCTEAQLKKEIKWHEEALKANDISVECLGWSHEWKYEDGEWVRR